MAEKRPTRLGDLQLRILQVLWDAGEASVSDVHLKLGEGYAYTTIATMLRKMEARRLVRHREDGRRFIYRAQLAEEEVSQSLTDRLVDQVFQGSVTAAVHHLLESRDVNRDELAELERMIRQHKRATRGE